MIGYILDITPYWVWAAALAVVLVATFQVWSPVWLVLPRWVKELVLFTLGVAGAYLAGRNRGSANERDKQKRANESALKRRREVEDEIKNLDGDGVNKRLNKWMRD